MDKLTKEQIKEFWEWCGFRCRKNSDPLMCFWETRDGRTWGYELPPVDLNNLFEYAVPKLRELKYYVVLRDISKEFHCFLIYTTAEKQSYYGESNDPALALFWAIWEVIKNDCSVLR